MILRSFKVLLGNLSKRVWISIQNASEKESKMILEKPPKCVWKASGMILVKHPECFKIETAVR